MIEGGSGIPAIGLSDGNAIPQLGFGVLKIPPQDTAAAVAAALDAGYRHIDTAASYQNEAGVGAGLRASGLPRDEVFVTTKCFNVDHDRAATVQALRDSLALLELDFVDLYLIHWPLPSKDQYVETWRGLIDLREQGLARSIGVSNFQPAHLERIIDETGVTPAVNQIELHPGFQQPGLRAVHAQLGITTEAWAPLAKGRALEDPTIGGIAAAHGRTPAQVVLRWHLQLGNVAIPKSVTPQHMRSNLEVMDFSLSPEQLTAIAALDSGRRDGPDPDTFTWP